MAPHERSQPSDWIFALAAKRPERLPSSSASCLQGPQRASRSQPALVSKLCVFVHAKKRAKFYRSFPKCTIIPGNSCSQLARPARSSRRKNGRSAVTQPARFSIVMHMLVCRSRAKNVQILLTKVQGAMTALSKERKNKRTSKPCIQTLPAILSPNGQGMLSAYSCFVERTNLGTRRRARSLRAASGKTAVKTGHCN